MNNSQAANTGENKRYIERRVQEIGDERGLDLTTEWEDPENETMGTYNLTVRVPDQNPVAIPFSANELRWDTYQPDPEEDLEAFSRNEEELQSSSYERKQRWDKQIRKALSGFGQSNNPIGFRS